MTSLITPAGDSNSMFLELNLVGLYYCCCRSGSCSSSFPPLPRLTSSVPSALSIFFCSECSGRFQGLYGYTSMPAEQIGQLWSVQNSAARLVLKKCKRDHITRLLHELHWLPNLFILRVENNFCAPSLRQYTLTFQLCSTHIKLYASSDPQARSF